MFKKYFLLLVFSSLLLSCGKKTTVKQSSTSSSVETFEDLSELTAALNKQRVVCGEYQKYCPGFASKVTFWGKNEEGNYYLGVCSGTLYQNKYIITNSHCIPNELRVNGSSCENQIKILFPETNKYSAESVKCERIKQVFSLENDGPDLAVIELNQSVYRENVKILKDAFFDNSRVYAYTMNPSKYDNTLGTIVKKSCTLSIDNAYLMSTAKNLSKAVLYGNLCDVISGNSGSGLFNEMGEYIGAIFAKVEMEKLASILKDKKINHRFTVPMGIVQNIGCLNSIISDDGVNCTKGENNNNDFDQFIERSKSAYSLLTENDSLIHYEVIDGFKLKLSKINNNNTSFTLNFFKTNWLTAFFDKSSENSFKEDFIN
jgi:hypothetical protein